MDMACTVTRQEGHPFAAQCADDYICGRFAKGCIDGDGGFSGDFRHIIKARAANDGNVYCFGHIDMFSSIVNFTGE